MSSTYLSLRLVGDCSGRLRVFCCDYRAKEETKVEGVGAALAAVRDKLTMVDGAGGGVPSTGNSSACNSCNDLSRRASDVSIQDLPADLQGLGEDFGSPQMLMRTLSFSSAVSGSSSRPGSAHGDRGPEGLGLSGEGSSNVSRGPIGVALKVGGEASWLLVYNSKSKQAFSLEGAGGLTVWSLVRGYGD